MKVLIYGAGAIGRGYLAPLLIQYGASISFVDINTNIIDLMKKTKKYTTLTTTDNGYDSIDVSISSAYLLNEEDEYIEHLEKTLDDSYLLVISAGHHLDAFYLFKQK